MNLKDIFGKDNIYRTQVIYLICAGFFGLMAYPLTRTSAAPYFNEAFGSEYLSWAMIAAAVLAIIVVSIYNQLAKRVPLIPLCIYVISFMVVANVLFGALMGNHPRWMALVYYAWSDVYIVVLVEQFWSISNTLFDRKTAKNFYGIFLASGSTGALVGNLMVTRMVETVGPDNMIFLSAGSLTVFTIFITFLNQSISENIDLKDRFEIERNIANKSTIGGASLVFTSSYLTLIALIILATQIYINGAYFIYNRFLDTTISTVQTQSAFYGKAFFIIQIITIFLSAVVTPLFLRFLGVAKTHYSIILTIAIIFAITAVSPQLALVAVLFMAAKSFDYSIFRAAKEMFYLPLHVAEKFQAKSFIDVFIYRFSKAVAALGIILVGQIFKLSIFYLVGFGIAAWLILIMFILRLYLKISNDPLSRLSRK